MSDIASEAEPVSPSGEAWRGLRSALPVMAGFVPFALVLGAQASQKGFSPVEVPLLTGINFGGGSEFAAIGLWTSPPHILLIVAMTFLVNCRHILMGAALAPYLAHLRKREVLPALYLMCDEAWALGIADARRLGRLSLPYYMGAAVGLYVTWIVSTALGSFIGPVLGDVSVYGFDMAFPAVFLVLMSGMWQGWRAARPWLVSLIVAAVTHLLVPGAWYVAAGAIAGIFAAYLLAEETA